MVSYVRFSFEAIQRVVKVDRWMDTAPLPPPPTPYLQTLLIPKYPHLTAATVASHL